MGPMRIMRIWRRMSILESGSWASCMGKDFLKQKSQFTMAYLSTGLNTVKGKKNSQTATHTKASTKTVVSTASASTDGRTVQRLTKARSRTDSGTEKANGHKTKPSTLAIMWKAWKKGMVSCIFRVAIFTRGILLMTGEKRMERCFGLMVHFIRGSGKMGRRMERDKFILVEMRLWAAFFKTASSYKSPHRPFNARSKTPKSSQTTHLTTSPAGSSASKTVPTHKARASTTTNASPASTSQYESHSTQWWSQKCTSDHPSEATTA